MYIYIYIYLSQHNPIYNPLRAIWLESEVFCIIVSMSDLELIALRMAPGSTAGSEQLTNATLDLTHNVRILGYFMTMKV